MRSMWFSSVRPEVENHCCRPGLSFVAAKPLGTTSAALGKRPWYLKAAGIIERASAPLACRNTNRCRAG